MDGVELIGLPKKIFEAIQLVEDQTTFLEGLLIRTLDWPIEEGIIVDDLSFEWSTEELRADDLDRHIADGRILQLRNFQASQPWGIFILEFQNPDVFTKGRGLVTPLRRVLRGLVPSKRRDSQLAAWQRENLLFICTYEYRHFRFAYFKAQNEPKKRSPLALFGWTQGESHLRTICEHNLSMLTWSSDLSNDRWLKRWGSAFDIEKVTREFYREYDAVFKNVEFLIKRRGELDDDAEVRLFTQTLFNRLMFLRFNERKGWLKFQDKKEYLSALYHAERNPAESIYQSRIRHLFFDALAVKGSQKSDAIGEVPFMDGGLFDESLVDKKVTDLPDEVFRGIIGKNGLFYRYNFTIEESTPFDIEVAVDPEMLGKVFEELVTGRHESGSYYTPRPVVDFMCSEALKGYLGGGDAINVLVDDLDASQLDDPNGVLEKLRNIKVCDLACGSGAYLVGMMHKLLELYHCLDEQKNVDPRTDYERKLEILQNNIYGVDIDPFAVNIARLRLWLSLVIEYEGDNPLPLPNLDFKIAAGDSLFSINPDFGEWEDVFRKQYITRFEALKGEYQNTSDHEEKATKYRELNNQRKEIASYFHYDDNIVGFDWRVEFAEVWSERDGFDVVIANPPYVKASEIGPQKEQLRKLYQDAVNGNSDLFCYFYARALQLLRPGGFHIFICSNSWLDTKYGIYLKTYMLQKAAIKAIYQSEAERQFSTAEINTLVSIMQKKACPDYAPRFISLKSNFESSIRDSSQRKEYVFNDQKELSGKTEEGLGKYFRAPEIYWKLLTEHKEYFTNLGKFAKVGTSNISPNWCSPCGSTSPPEYCTKIFSKPRDIKTIRIQAAISAYYIENDYIPARLQKAPPLIWGEFRNAIHLCHFNEDRLPFTTAYFGILPNEGVDPLQLCLCLNSTLQWLFIEVEGRTALGAGAIRLTSGDLPKMTIINPSSVKLDGIDSTFLNRTQLNCDQELQQPDRRAFDEMIFDHIGLSDDERQAIYEGVLDLVNKRLKKAKSKAGLN